MTTSNDPPRPAGQARRRVGVAVIAAASVATAVAAAPAVAAPAWPESVSFSATFWEGHTGDRTPNEPQIALDSQGNAVTVWATNVDSPNPEQAQVSTRPRGGAWTTPADPRVARAHQRHPAAGGER